jgi:hypothetical protein
MDMDNSAVFLAASILMGLGFIVVGITIIVLNNLFAKYWKPIEWSIIPEAIRNYTYTPSRFDDQHEIEPKIPPVMDKAPNEKLAKK